MSTTSRNSFESSLKVLGINSEFILHKLLKLFKDIISKAQKVQSDHMNEEYI